MNGSVSRFEWTPAMGWQAVVVDVCLAGMAAVAVWLVVRALRQRTETGTAATQSVDRTRLCRRVSMALSLVGILLLALAALDLRKEVRESFDAPTVVVLLDESDSVRRESELRRRELETLATGLTEALSPAGITSEPANRVQSVKLVRFSGSSAAAKTVPVSQLSASLFESGTATDGTDIEAALHRAADTVHSTKGVGVVLLCSDGNQTSGDAVAAARRLAGEGIPVHVVPLTSPGPALFLHGNSVPSTVTSESLSAVRTLIRNSGSRDQAGILEIALHHNALKEATPLVLPLKKERKPITFRAGQTSGLRQPLSFRGRGLQFVELKLTPVADADPRNGEGGGNGLASGKVATSHAGTHRVTRPVYVQGKARILAIGNDTRWDTMVDRERWEVTVCLPGDALQHLNNKGRDFDAVVLSAVDSKRLEAGLLPELRRQVEQLGTGLLLINGDHEQADEKTPSVLMSYLKTELEPILPVNPGPREHIEKPPPQRVVITVDASGSMSGQRMSIAHAICGAIIDKLRPIDTLEVIVFRTTSSVVLSRRNMDPDGKAAAIAKVAGIQAYGGTDPNVTLAVIQGLNLMEGAFVMICDGDMSLDYAQSLQGVIGRSVFSKAFGAGLPEIPETSPLYQFKHRKAVPSLASIPSLKFEPTEPEKRDKYFERKQFIPGQRLLDDQDKSRGWLPGLTLPGHAVSTLSDHDSTRLIGLHPENSDPILAFRDAGLGRVGVFSCGIPNAWLDDPDPQRADDRNAAAEKAAARKAVTAWCEEVSAFSVPDRYWMDVTRNRNRLEVRLVAFKAVGQPVFLNGVTLTLRRDGVIQGSEALKPDERGFLCGSLQIPEQVADGVLHLMIEESGARGIALPRRQRVPVVLPRQQEHEAGSEPNSTAAEKWTQGINHQLLEQIAGAGSGRVLDRNSEWPDLRATPRRQTRTHYWQELASASAMAVVLAVFLNAVGRKW